MRKKVAAIIISLLIFAGAGIGCGGGGARLEASTSTLGQELTDLHKAYEQGIITEKEYNSKKKQLMKKR